jgi:hypothetical protein
MQYHFILTLMVPAHGGPRAGTFSGVVDVPCGRTRDEVFQELYKDAVSMSGMTDANVMLFDLAPNTLATP